MSEISYYVASCLHSGFLTLSTDYKCRSEIKNSKTRKCKTLWGEPEQADMEILPLMSDVITSSPGPAQLFVDGKLGGTWERGNDITHQVKNPP